MPVRKNLIPLTLLVGIYSSETKLKLPYDHALYLKDISEANMKEYKSIFRGRTLLTHVHCSII
jgi:hypothetical protein